MADNAFVLRIAPGKGTRVAEALDRNHLIIGWAKARGLLEPSLDWWDFRELIHRTYYADESSRRRAGAASGHMWRFIREMEVGDLVVVPDGPQFYVGVVAGQAFYDETNVDDDTAYRRCVTWLNKKRGIQKSMARVALVSRMKTRGTSANAKDLVGEIEVCVREAGQGGAASFESDLRRGMTRVALEELREGRIENFGFERLIENAMRALGAVETRIVPRNKDKGIDVYATFLVAGAFRQVVGIQAKHFSPTPPVGAEPVRQLIHGMEEGPENVTLGMVITSGEYSTEAMEAAQAHEEETGIPIELVDGEQFAALIVEHGSVVARQA
ncbi:MAG: restriction endonuclease [Gammaproteobacteria bacterium]|nr:restriction endonuclease [Gammaproteobacteria bacterium]